MGHAAFAPNPELAVIAIDLPQARRLAFGVVLGQVAVTVLVALGCWVLADSRAAISALLGGGISSSASLVMAVLSFAGSAATEPRRALRALYVGESAKVAIVIVLFVAVLKTMKVVALAMLGSFIATWFVFWIALAGALPALSFGAGRGFIERMRS
jgi:ATP synthase protein I